jgi:hypothetical protein
VSATIAVESAATESAGAASIAEGSTAVESALEVEALLQATNMPVAKASTNNFFMLILFLNRRKGIQNSRCTK